uniref:DUF2878 domain-containing protein n=1 Tax=Cellvibrio fontiphilus TaxID=1815559 RepID=UPI002B4BFA42|nr:DUF2878 domain-containing protein [Cellvibrio fontiphilus]
MNAGLFTLSNFLLFQLGWFVCVLLGTQWAIVYTLVATCAHFYFSPSRQDDAIAVLLCIVIGLVHDLLLIHGGYILFAEANNWPPVWLSCLWVLMGLTLHHSLGWIYQRPLWAGLLGAVSGPLSYLAGVKLSSAQWSGSLMEVIPIMAVLWLIVLPLHRLLSLRIKPYVSH